MTSMTYEGEFTFTVRWSYERRIGEKASFLFHKDGDNIVKKIVVSYRKELSFTFTHRSK